MAHNQTTGVSMINPLGGSSSDATGLGLAKAINVTNDAAALNLTEEPGPINEKSSDDSQAENQFVFKND